MVEIEDSAASLKKQLQTIGKRMDVRVEARSFGKKAPASKLKTAASWAPAQLLALWKVVNGLHFEWAFVDMPHEVGAVRLMDIDTEKWQSAADFGRPDEEALLVDAPLPELLIYYLRKGLEEPYLVATVPGEEVDHTTLSIENLAGYLRRGLECGFKAYWQVDEDVARAAKERLAAAPLNFGRFAPGDRCRVKNTDIKQNRGIVKEVRCDADEPFALIALDHGDHFWLHAAQLTKVKSKDAYERFMAAPTATVERLEKLDAMDLGCWWGRIGGYATGTTSFCEPFEAAFGDNAKRYAGLLRQLGLRERANHVASCCQKWRTLDATYSVKVKFDLDGSEYFAKDYSLGDTELEYLVRNMLHGFLLSVIGDYPDGHDQGLAELVDPAAHEQLSSFAVDARLDTRGLSHVLETSAFPSGMAQQVWHHHHRDGDPSPHGYLDYLSSVR